MNEGYQGYRNWETFNANLWLNSDKDVQAYLLHCQNVDQVEELYDVVWESGFITDDIRKNRIDFQKILEAAQAE